MKDVKFIICITLLFVFKASNAQEVDKEDYHYFNVVASLEYNIPLKQRVQSAIEGYCRKFGSAPKTVPELLDFCIASDYHPNDMIIDDFDIELLRIKEDYNGFYLVYFIGPDGVDDDCEVIMSQEEINELNFEKFMPFKGDIVLGGIENEVISLYKEKFLLNEGN